MMLETISGLRGNVWRYERISDQFTEGTTMSVVLLERTGEVPMHALRFSVHTLWEAPDGRIEAANGEYDLNVHTAEKKFTERVERYRDEENDR